MKKMTSTFLTQNLKRILSDIKETRAAQQRKQELADKKQLQIVTENIQRITKERAIKEEEERANRLQYIEPNILYMVRYDLYGIRNNQFRLIDKPLFDVLYLPGIYYPVTYLYKESNKNIDDEPGMEETTNESLHRDVEIIDKIRKANINSTFNNDVTILWSMITKVKITILDEADQTEYINRMLPIMSMESIEVPQSREEFDIGDTLLSADYSGFEFISGQFGECPYYKQPYQNLLDAGVKIIKDACLVSIILNNYLHQILDTTRRGFSAETKKLYSSMNPYFAFKQDIGSNKPGWGFSLNEVKQFFKKHSIKLTARDCELRCSNIVWQYIPRTINSHINKQSLHIYIHDSHAICIEDGRAINGKLIYKTMEEEDSYEFNFWNDIARQKIEEQKKFKLKPWYIGTGDENNTTEFINYKFCTSQDLNTLVGLIHNSTKDLTIYALNQDIQSLPMEDLVMDFKSIFKQIPYVDVTNSIIEKIIFRNITNPNGKKIQLHIVLSYNSIHLTEAVSKLQFTNKYMSHYSKELLDYMTFYPMEIPQGQIKHQELELTKDCPETINGKPTGKIVTGRLFPQYHEIDCSKDYIDDYLKLEYIPVYSTFDKYTTYKGEKIVNYFWYLIEWINIPDIFHQKKTRIIGYNLKQYNHNDYIILQYLPYTRLPKIDPKIKAEIKKMYCDDKNIEYDIKLAGNSFIGLLGKYKLVSRSGHIRDNKADCIKIQKKLKSEGKPMGLIFDIKSKKYDTYYLHTINTEPSTTRN